MRSLPLIIAAALLTGCAVTPPKPSIWQIESQCASSQPLATVESCTRDGLSENYGDAWQSSPEAVQFLDFIGATASRVDAGALSEADGRLAVSTYAEQMSAAIHSEQLAAQQERQQEFQREMAALAQDSPGSQGVAAAGRALEGQYSSGAAVVPASGPEVYMTRDLGVHGLFHLCRYSDGRVYSFNATQLCPLDFSTPALPSGTVGMKIGSYQDGMTKVCIYNVLGSREALRISAAALCPLSHTF